MMHESLEDRRLMTVEWRNPVDALDINADGFIVPLDALVAINYLNTHEPTQLPPQRNAAEAYLDVNGDQFATPIDVLLVINHLNTGGSGQRELRETGKLAHESDIVVTLGQTAGTRVYSVQLDAQFDTTDESTAVDDLLAVYLVDPQQPSTTLLDRGSSGTALFTLSGNSAEFEPGRVSWDGSVLQIDVSDLSEHETGLLKFQLLSSDSDHGTRVVIKPLNNQVDSAGTSGPVLPWDRLLKPVGPALNTDNLVLESAAEVQFENIRFDTRTGIYQAEVRLRSNENALGRDVVAAFPDLPEGVQLRNRSGETGNGTPYVHLGPAIPHGGLLHGLWTDPVLVEFDDPSQLLFALKPQVFAGTNHAPTLAPLAPVTVLPGGVLKISIVASDPDFDPLTFSMVAAGGTGVSGTLQADGTLVLRPKPNELGVHQFDVSVTDGALTATRSLTVNVAADPLTTTRVSGKVMDVDGTPLANMTVEIAAVRGLTQADGSFTLDLGSGPVVSDTLKVRGDLFSGAGAYPFIAEKMPLVLEHDVYPSVNNVIDRPIYLPVLDLANGAAVNPTQDTTVTTSAMPGAKVVIAAGTLLNQQGTPFTGVLSMTQVPMSLTPAALPEGLIPDLVVTIQPGEMVFATPAPLSLPNSGGYAPGTLLDLWSINPVSGEFDNVGVGQVSADGSVIETASGGIRNSSWHFFSPPAPTGPKDDGDPRNRKPGGCGDSAAATSSCEMHSGALLESHNLVTYQSQGATRGLRLTYDSLRADPRPIVHFTFSELDPNLYSVPEAVRLVAELDVSRDGFFRQTPGYTGNAHGLNGNEHFWRLPAGAGSVDAALQVDLRDQPSGVFDYTLRSGMLGYAGSRGFIGTLGTTSGQVTSVNTIRSPLGAGWGISGMYELVENSDGSVLVIDGNGSEEVFTPNGNGGYDNPPGVFATLSKLLDETFQRRWPDQTLEQYNSLGKLATITDRNGNVTQYEYDSSGRLTKLIDPVGLATTIVYSTGRVEIVDPAARITRLDLDASGNLVQVTDPDGSIRRWQYDAHHRMTGEIDQLGNAERSQYGFHGRLVQINRKDGSARRYAPLDTQGLFPSEQTTADPIADAGLLPLAGRVPPPESVFADANGNVTRSILDQHGQVVSSRDSLGALTSVLRNGDNLPVKVTDGRGQATWFAYDANGNVLSESADLHTRQATFGSAAEFKGEVRNTNYLAVPDSPTMQSSDVTLEGWVNIAELDEYVTPLFGKDDRYSKYSYAVWLENGQLKSTISDGLQNHLVSAPWAPALGRWYHIAFTFDDATNTQSLLVDGSVVATGMTNASIFYASSDLHLGAKHFNYAATGAAAFSVLSGSMDEVRLWNFARTPSDIRRDMFHTLSGHEAGLVAYYPFEEAGTNEYGDTTTLDRSLNHLDGTWLGTADVLPPPFESSVPTVAAVQTPSGLVSWWSADGYANDLTAGNNGSLSRQAVFTPAVVGLGFLFDGQDDHVRVDDPADGSLDVVGDMTIDAWIYPTQISGNQRTIVQKRPASGNNEVAYGFYLEEDGRLAFTSRSIGGQYHTVSTGPAVSGNTWSHVAVTINGNTLKLYINGAEAASHPYAFSRPSTNGPLSIGATLVDDAPSHGFAGSIDEVQVFRRALTTDEIRAIVQADRAGQAKPVVFDAASDFSLSANPNGSWQYGFSTVQDSAFNGSTSPMDDGKLLVWGASANGPYVIRPRTRTPQNYATIKQSADVLNLDPSLNGRNSVVQWTAPADGTYWINGRFEGLDSTTTGVTILLNDDAATPLVSGNINGYGSVVPFRLHKTLSAGDRIQFTVNPQGNSLFDSTGLSATIVLEGSSAEAADAATQPGRATQTFTYESNFNQLTSLTDEIGRQTLYAIDPANGNTLGVTQVVGGVGGGDDLFTAVSYTASGQIETLTDPGGIVTRFVYDAMGRLIEIHRASGTAEQVEQSFQYDAAGRITADTDENGATTRYQYDAMNRLTGITDADGSTTTYAYDQRGNQRSSTNALGQTQRRTYDPLGRLVTGTDSAGNITRYTYDVADNVTSITDPLGHAKRYQYDVRGRRTAESDAGAGATRYQYDVLDRLTSVQDPSGNKTTFSYDALGRVVERTDAFGKTAHSTYDAAGQLLQLIDRSGRATRLSYNDLGQLVTETWLSEDLSVANTIQYAYDATGALAQANDAFSALVVTRDGLGRVTREQHSGSGGIPTTLLDVTYDSVGNLLTLRDTINGVVGATNASTYDNMHRVTRLVQTGAGMITKRVDFAYDALGRASSFSRYADAAGQWPVAGSTFEYDALGRLTRLAHRNAANAVLDSFAVQYDAADRITKVTGSDGDSDYTYDARDQLIAATHADPLNPDETYAYDASGNRTLSHLHGSGYVLGDRMPGTSDGNRLTSDGRFTYSYDDNGNLVERVENATGQLRELTYDHRNRLVQIADRPREGTAATRVIKYTYDLLDRRIATNVDTAPADGQDGASTYFVYAGQDIIAELIDPDGSGPQSAAISMRYLHGPAIDQVLAQETADGDVHWMLSDHLGTVRDLIDNSGVVENHIQYDAYGNIVSQSDAAVSTRYGFTGRESDAESGLQYNRARYYDAAIGRFLSEDPLGLGGGDVNLYRYVGNYPTGAVDPMGLRALSSNEAIAAARAAAAAQQRDLNRAARMANGSDADLEAMQEQLEAEAGEQSTADGSNSSSSTDSGSGSSGAAAPRCDINPPRPKRRPPPFPFWLRPLKLMEAKRLSARMKANLEGMNQRLQKYNASPHNQNRPNLEVDMKHFNADRAKFNAIWQRL